MASVFIDIPGVGNVEAKNAATESTLRELVNIMKGVQQNTKSKSGPGGPGGSADDAKGPAQKLTSMAGSAGASLKTFASAARITTAYLDGFSEGLVDTIQKFANVGDSVERAANVFAKVPIVGVMFTAVAAAAAKVTDSYLAVAKSGATFGGSMTNFASAASSAGMTMDKFGLLIARNGDGMLALGATTEEGAKRFSQISKTLRSSSSDLYALGFSTEDVNQGLASYGKLLRIQGRQGTMTNDQLAAGAKNYLKEIDALAKATGVERAQIEEKLKQVQEDAQFHAYMSTKAEDVRTSFAGLITTAKTASPELASMMQDVITTGSLTSAENAKNAGLIGDSGLAALQEMHRMAEAGEKMSAAKQDALLRQLHASADEQMKLNGKTLSATGGEFDGFIKTHIGLQKLRDASLEKAKEAQINAADGTDKMNKKMQEAQQMLAGFSNSFQMALANSGMLDLMLKAFQFVAGFVQTFLVPAFQILSSIITGVSSIVTDYLYPAFLHIADYITQTVQPIFQAMGEFIGNSVTPIFKTMGEFIDAELMPIFRVMGEFIDTNLSTILQGLSIALGIMYARTIIQTGIAVFATGVALAAAIAQGIFSAAVMAGAVAMALLTSPVFLVIAGITALWFAFKKLGGDFDIVRDGLKFMWSMFKTFLLNLKLGFLKVLDYLPGVDMKDAITETEADIAEQTTEREKLVDNIKTRAADNRAKLDEKQAAEKAARHDRVDKKLLNQKESANAQQKAALDAKRNLDASETSLLVDEATRQKSAYIKDKPSTSVATAEATKASIVTEAEQKRAAAEAPAKKTEEEKKAEESKKESGKGPGPSTQDSPATLLASLNTKMDQLIKHAAVTQSNTYETYRATNGLSGNLYKSV